MALAAFDYVFTVQDITNIIFSVFQVNTENTKTFKDFFKNCRHGFFQPLFFKNYINFNRVTLEAF